MSALTQAATKSITSNIGMKLYHLTTVNDADTLSVPFETVLGIKSCNRSSADTVYVTVTGSTLTFNVAGGATPTVDLKVWGR